MLYNIDILKKDLVRIENIKSFLIDIPQIHPDLPKYDELWKRYQKWSVEGYWAFDNGGWRFMPATLFFYANFFKISDSDIHTKERRFIKPKVRDLDWQIHYAVMEAQGFSGFINDDEYSADEALLYPEFYVRLEKDHGVEAKKRFLNIHKKNGQRKSYVSPREYLKKLHSEDLGRPLFANRAKNLMIFGRRGSGKSFSVSGLTAQIMTFDGLREYTRKAFENPPTAQIAIGASVTDKSSELIEKVVDGLNFLGLHHDLGVWGDPEDPDTYMPNPFYRNWVGDTKPGNKKNPFRYEYEIETPTGWVKKGTKTSLRHINYSDKKQDGNTAAAGGRYPLVVYEEVGLMPNFRDALLSNIGTVSVDGEQFGVQLALGTSGDIELVQQSKQIFNNPSEYNFLEFDNIWEPNDKVTKIGFFIPAYLGDLTFCDQNGNTDIERSIQHYVNRRLEAAEKNDPTILYNEKMNYPLVPSDMWIANKGSYFPQYELAEREKELLKGNLYREIGTPTKLIWDSSQPYGVKAEYDQDSQPFFEFPWDRTMSSLNGALMIYRQPEFIKGEIPRDMYIFTLDPYVSENIDEGGSLGSFQGFLNPKYHKEGISGTMVCSYHGKHEDGKDAFYSIVEKTLAYYGNCPRSLWYEANRGDSVKGYFVRKNKSHLLALRPYREQGSSAYAKRVQEYGYYVNGQGDKIEMIDNTAEWLLSKITYEGRECRVVETIPDIFVVRQLIQFELKGNYDAVMALLGFPLALKEFQHVLEAEIKKREKLNPLGSISMNSNLFKDVDTIHRIKRINEKIRQQYAGD